MKTDINNEKRDIKTLIDGLARFLDNPRVADCYKVIETRRQVEYIKAVLENRNPPRPPYNPVPRAYFMHLHVKSNPPA